MRRAGDIQIKRLPCRIEAIEKIAPDVAIVRFKLPANERLQFLAGQYIDFLLKDGKRRSFSLATPPHDDQLLELHVRHIPDGFFTDALFTQYKGREILRLEGPARILLPARGLGQADRPGRRRHGLRADQGDHRARAVSQAAPRDGAVLGRARIA
ncbi:MAG: FAD-binding oxidoreductase [Sphingomonas sp.]